ncbi:MAG TPA: HprK-related kinase A [Aliidongia sp.]|uniref:HprK-related kinase A n=1 Tax=Aliidongia sp. TaxID=1914230 RepID=UPI002DDCAE83|nr:HprK-related kinase A [Aliidongia sp.]HEV2673679.1 HprK-related kinase A [Aliidongia sp.]
MIIGDLSSDKAIRRLSGSGITVRMGPFQVRVGSKIRHFCEQFVDLYRHHRLGDAEDFIDFDLQLKQRWSWIAPFGRVAAFEFNGYEPVAALPIEQAMPLFEWGLNWCVTAQSHRFVMIHAGIVARDDQALVMPGSSGSGKSTLTTALCYRGWRLLSDELALIDIESGLVHPMPRPISLKNKSIPTIQAFASEIHIGSRVSETRKGEVALLRPPAASVADEERLARVTRFLFPLYDPDTTADGLAITPGQAFVKTFDSTFNYGIHGKRDFALLADLMERAPAAEIRYSDLDAAIALIEGPLLWPTPLIAT